MSDFLGSALTISFVFIFLFLSEILAKFNYLTKENARKLIHISVGNVILFIPIFDTRWVAALIPGIFVIGNFFLSPMSPINRFRLRTFQAGHSWGTILYPLSLSLTTFLFFSKPWIVVAVFFPVVYGDGIAAILGPRANKGIFTVTGTEKTLIGTSSIALYTWASVCIGILILGYSLQLAIITASIVAVITPFIELLSPKGTDNLVIPIVLTFIMLALHNDIVSLSSNIQPLLYLYGLIFGMAFAIGGYSAGFLTHDGAMTGFMITTFLLGIGGITLGVELFLFFVLGSLATKVVAKIAGHTQKQFEKGSERRDSIQAIAKAGLPAFIVLIFVIDYSVMIFYLISGILVSALVDTMATEIGIATNGTPVHVLKPWKKAEPGDTGVISFNGSVGGIIMGLIFASITYFVNKIDIISLELQFVPHMIILTIGGLIGMLADSIIGTTIQRQNQCQVCDKIVEANYHHDSKTRHHSGISWFNNDITNFLGTTIGGLFAFFIAIILLG